MLDVSVVIATHNRARLVKEAIDSVLRQTEPVREIIVVDDGSTDDTRAELAAYGQRIRFFTQPPAGASAARNRAMREAQGEWLAFLDDDDVWLETKIERQMEIVRRNKQLGLVYCSDYAVDHQLQILHTRTAAAENRGMVFGRLLIRNFIFTSCVIARRDAVSEAGYMRHEFRFAQDWDLWLKIAARYPIDFVEEPLVLYRHSPTGCLTRDMKFADQLTEMQTIQEYARNLCRVPSAVLRRSNCEMQLKWASNFLQAGRNMRALSHLVRAIGYEPGCQDAYRLIAHSLVPKTARDWMKQIMAAH